MAIPGRIDPSAADVGEVKGGDDKEEEAPSEPDEKEVELEGDDKEEEEEEEAPCDGDEKDAFEGKAMEEDDKNHTKGEGGKAGQG